MKHHKFEFSDSSDFDCRVEELVIKGKTTPLRTKLLESFTSRYNVENEAPYGLSPNGYAYTCGCLHDCCGCLIRTSMRLDEIKLGYTLTISTSYNL